MLVKKSQWRKYSSSEIGPVERVAADIILKYNHREKKLELIRNNFYNFHAAYIPYSGDGPAVYLDDLYKFNVDGKSYYCLDPDTDELDDSMVEVIGGSESILDKTEEALKLARTSDDKDTLDTLSNYNNLQIWGNLLLNENLSDEQFKKCPSIILQQFMSQTASGRNRVLSKYILTPNQLFDVLNYFIDNTHLFDKALLERQFNNLNNILKCYKLIPRYDIEIDKNVLAQLDAIGPQPYIDYINKHHTFSNNTRNLKDSVTVLYNIIPYSPAIGQIILSPQFLEKFIDIGDYSDVLYHYITKSDDIINYCINIFDMPLYFKIFKYYDATSKWALSEQSINKLYSNVMNNIQNPNCDSRYYYILEKLFKSQKNFTKNMRDEALKVIINTKNYDLFMQVINNEYFNNLYECKDVKILLFIIDAMINRHKHINIKYPFNFSSEQFDLLMSSGNIDNDEKCETLVRHTLNINEKQAKLVLSNFNKSDELVYQLITNAANGAVKSYVLSEYPNYAESRNITEKLFLDPDIPVDVKQSLISKRYISTYYIRKCPNLNIELLKAFLQDNESRLDSHPYYHSEEFDSLVFDSVLDSSTVLNCILNTTKNLENVCNTLFSICAKRKEIDLIEYLVSNYGEHLTHIFYDAGLYSSSLPSLIDIFIKNNCYAFIDRVYEYIRHEPYQQVLEILLSNENCPQYILQKFYKTGKLRYFDMFREIIEKNPAFEKQ